MRWTRTFIPTLREAPSDAESASHKWMVRAGLVRQLAAGIYSYLPLGVRALHKAARLVRDEMDAAGASELLLPALHPAELWKETGRFDLFGDTLFRIEDRRGASLVLGPTHEEIVTHLVRNESKSYRQLPILVYQIQTKFRDEPRPRFGVVRTKEFLMKDAYSFDADEKGLARSYQAMYDAYVRIFTRAKLDFLPVEAETGAMGGDVSHEFIAISPAGEDEVLTCSQCPYAANRERAECGPLGEGGFPARETREMPPMEAVDTPGRSTIEEVSEFLQVEPSQLVKTLIFRTDGGFVAALVRGDHEVNVAKLRRVLKAEVLELATAEEIAAVTGGPLGFSGPVGLAVPMVADRAVESLSNCVTGANRADTHLKNVTANRDFRPREYADLRYAGEGDPCPKCGAPLRLTRGIEIGHVFKLGTRYSIQMGCDYLDAKGAKRPLVMGSYGIGINRILAAAVENHHDEAGILWPKEIAPFQLELVTVNPQGDLRLDEISRDLYEGLTRAGWEVLWDDRDLSPGVKFNDADLLGLPIRITVGKKTLSPGTVDVKPRQSKEQRSVSLAEVQEAVKNAWTEYPL